MREIPEELRQGPFTLARAAEFGVSRKVVNGRRFRAPCPGVRVLADSPDTLADRCRALALVLPAEAAFSHGTAVRLDGWPTPLYGPASEEVHVSVPHPAWAPTLPGVAPQVNVWVRDSGGEPIHRPDLSWPRWRVAADYDGAHHFEQDDTSAVLAGRRSNWRRRHDISRQDQLMDAGWQLRVFTAYDLITRHERSVERMRSTLRRAGAPV